MPNNLPTPEQLKKIVTYDLYDIAKGGLPYVQCKLQEDGLMYLLTAKFLIHGFHVERDDSGLESVKPGNSMPGWAYYDKLNGHNQRPLRVGFSRTYRIYMMHEKVFVETPNGFSFYNDGEKFAVPDTNSFQTLCQLKVDADNRNREIAEYCSRIISESHHSSDEPFTTYLISPEEYVKHNPHWKERLENIDHLEREKLEDTLLVSDLPV